MCCDAPNRADPEATVEPHEACDEGFWVCRVRACHLGVRSSSGFRVESRVAHLLLVDVLSPEDCDTCLGQERAVVPLFSRCMHEVSDQG